MTIFVVFGVNVGKLGTVYKPHIPSLEWIPGINANLEQLLSRAHMMIFIKFDVVWVALAAYVPTYQCIRSI
jgi:hypothetical protein